MEIVQHAVVPVTERSQPSAARVLAHDLARELGYTEEDIYRAGLIATELATNLLKHAAGGGEVLLAGRSEDREIEIIAIDRGPGIRDPGSAMRDGHSTAGTLGLGLGGVRRMSDCFDLHSVAGKGTVVVARVRAGRMKRSARAFAIRAISVPRQGEDVCGDTWMAAFDGRSVTCMVADGLGHGPAAAAASREAARTLTAVAGTSLTEALTRINDALRPTRGAAASIAQVQRGAPQLRFAGVGNVAGSILHDEVQRHTVTVNGTLGQELRAVREYAYPWHSGDTFVMFSDGLSSHWTLDPYPGLLSRDPALTAAVLYRDFSRGRDDVTVLVGREAA